LLAKKNKLEIDPSPFPSSSLTFSILLFNNLDMNVRVKRGTETFFVPVDRSTAFLTLKQTLADIISDANTSVASTSPSDISLYKGDFSSDPSQMKELLDGGTVSDHEVVSDSVIFMVLAKDNGKCTAEGFSKTDIVTA